MARAMCGRPTNSSEANLRTSASVIGTPSSARRWRIRGRCRFRGVSSKGAGRVDKPGGRSHNAVFPWRRHPMSSTFRDLLQQAKTQIRETTPEEVRRELQGGKPPIVLDVREPDEVAKGVL